MLDAGEVVVVRVILTSAVDAASYPFSSGVSGRINVDDVLITGVSLNDSAVSFFYVNGSASLFFTNVTVVDVDSAAHAAVLSVGTSLSDNSVNVSLRYAKIVVVT
jgi:hypothetical protein